MDKQSVILAGIFAGLSSPGVIYSAPQYPTLQGSDLDRMRQCVQRVGDDFRCVIDRENGKASHKK